MPNFIEGFFGSQPQAPKAEVLKGTSEEPKSYKIEDGHAYVLLGGREEDVLTSCPGCGAPFKGPCQGACEFCSTQRKVHYLDISNTSLLSKELTAENDDLSLILSGDDSVEFGYDASVDIVIANKVTADQSFRAGLVITKRFEGSYDTSINTLILVDEGSASFDQSNWIGTLITGKNVGPLVFGYDTEIGTLMKSSGLKYRTDESFRINRTELINREGFFKAISGALQQNKK